jgi:hypothetical protein
MLTHLAVAFVPFDEGALLLSTPIVFVVAQVKVGEGNTTERVSLKKDKISRWATL